MKNIKTRAIAAIISAISAFSVVTMASQSAFAAEIATDSATGVSREDFVPDGYFKTYDEFLEYCAWQQENPNLGGVCTWRWLKDDPEGRAWMELFPDGNMFAYELYMDCKNRGMNVSDAYNSFEYSEGKAEFPQSTFNDFLDYLFDKYTCNQNIVSYVDYLAKQYN